MIQHIPWAKLTWTGRIFKIRESDPTDKWFLIKCVFCMAIDISLYFAATIASYRFLAWSLFTPAERGFYCDDPNIREEFRDNTVPTLTLLGITLAFPFIIIIVADFLAKIKKHPKELEQVFNHSTFIYLDYVIAFWLATLALDVIKCFVGRHRPNFLAMCEPKELHEICAHDPTAFVPIAHCTTGWKTSRNAKLSFPSGHACASTFASLFLFFYLRGVQRRYPCLTLKLFFILSTAASLIFTIFCCATRITDSWHHPTDVLGGILLGALLFHLLLHKYYKAFPTK